MSIVNQILIVTENNNVYETSILYENKDKNFIIFDCGINLKGCIINGQYKELIPDWTGRGHYFK